VYPFVVIESASVRAAWGRTAHGFRASSHAVDTDFLAHLHAGFIAAGGGLLLLSSMWPRAYTHGEATAEALASCSLTEPTPTWPTGA